MSSDSTCSEDEFNKIKEAVDVNFLTEDLYANDKRKKKVKSSPKPTSCRNQNHQNISINPFSVKVTPEFQNHVSKHLSQLLDELIDDTQIILRNKVSKMEHLRCGIKLLCSSKADLEVTDNKKPAVKQKKFVKKEKSDSSIFKKRAKEVAVTPDWVLSQEETKYWALNTKRNIEIVELVDYCNDDNLKKKKKRKKNLNIINKVKFVQYIWLFFIGF